MNEYVNKCERCERAGENITRRNEMPKQNIIICKIFGV